MKFLMIGFLLDLEADDYWQKYETNRGHNYKEALDRLCSKARV